MRKPRGTVYSTGSGRVCPNCGYSVSNCRCNDQTSIPEGDGIVRIQRSTKGRKGKCVTVVTGIPLGQLELLTLAKSLKRLCGSGGTVKNGVIEIQGDHIDLLLKELIKQGFTVKRSGG